MKATDDINQIAMNEVAALKSDCDLETQGFPGTSKVYWNLSTESLYEQALSRGEGIISHDGALVVRSGMHTARAARDKFIVRESSTESDVWWSEHNQAFSPRKFDQLLCRMKRYMAKIDLFVQDCYVGADPQNRMAIRIISEWAWHSIFARNAFILPVDHDAYRGFEPEFTIVCVPSFEAIPSIDGTWTGTFILLNFERRLCLIGGSGYAGEIKKSIFTVMNYLLPRNDVLPMHCSANIGKNDDVALFFGLSGTGKTSLSADIQRRLIGDDEHGWGEEGIFNLEAGCYAKVIRLRPDAEPLIHKTTSQFGTILENVICAPSSRQVNLDDASITENTRASYSLRKIDNAFDGTVAGHPRNIILLTCDASGVMPPLARLTPEQAVYHFISGYTAKVGGTEAGLRDEPVITFSNCFGAPFMVHHPTVYADLFKEKIKQQGVNCWLINTGWVGGPYGVGERIRIDYTRTMIEAVLSEKLDDVIFVEDPVFGYEVPSVCEGIPAGILDPASSWPSKDGYLTRYRQLAAKFVENFRRFEPRCPVEIRVAGPRIESLGSVS
jgi:phosphoenolpyruvate carboxykinase (ATP)